MRLLVPVKGPNESLKLQIKRHNELNIRNAEILYRIINLESLKNQIPYKIE
jgi:hypothetical protein